MSATRNSGDAYREMPKAFVKLFDRYVEDVLHEKPAVIRARAAKIYARYYDETPKIGGKGNPMAANLYEFIASIAYFEATDMRMNADSIETIMQWRSKPMRFAGKIFNLNHRSLQRIANWGIRMISRKT